MTDDWLPGGPTDAAAPGKKFRVKAHPLNIKPGFRGTSFNQIYDQLEAEDAAK